MSNTIICDTNRIDAMLNSQINYVYTYSTLINVIVTLMI